MRRLRGQLLIFDRRQPGSGRTAGKPIECHAKALVAVLQLRSKATVRDRSRDDLSHPAEPALFFIRQLHGSVQAVKAGHRRLPGRPAIQ
jgi:hypothetical protein